MTLQRQIGRRGGGARAKRALGVQAALEWAFRVEKAQLDLPPPHHTTAEASPVTFSPHPQQIEAARQGYGEWWAALGWVKEGLLAGGMLREVEVTEAMPRERAWGKR
jgi:hypothetical protein